MVNEAFEKEPGNTAEIDDSLCHIDGDGIESDDDKRESTFPVTPDVDNPVKSAEKNHTQPTGTKHI